MSSEKEKIIVTALGKTREMVIEGVHGGTYPINDAGDIIAKASGFSANNGAASVSTASIPSAVSSAALSGSVTYEEKPTIKKKTINPDKYISIGDHFMVQEPVKEVLNFNIDHSLNTMLLGPTGVGKTELIANIAKQKDLPLTIFDMGTMTDPIMAMVGMHAVEIKDGVTHSVFKKSRFSEVIQQPGIILLDEISRASAAANNLLFPCLDFRRQLAMEYCFKDPTPINIHPKCVFIATANLGSQYTGTHKLDMALRDRFMILEIDSLPKDQVKEIVRYLYPKLTDTQINFIITAYFAINEANDNFQISFGLSLRHVKNICHMVVNGFTIYDSYYIIVKGVGNKEGIKGIETILKTLQ